MSMHLLLAIRLAPCALLLSEACLLVCGRPVSAVVQLCYLRGPQTTKSMS